MATRGFFTVNDLYAGKLENYYSRQSVPPSPIASHSFWSKVEVLEDSVLTSTTVETKSLESNFSTTVLSLNELEKNVHLDTFPYLHWLLVSFAIFAILLLTVLLLYYCLRYCKKNRRQRNEKKQQTLPNFYRYRKARRHPPLYNIYESTAPLFFSSPVGSYRSKTPEKFNNQLLRQGLEAVGTPPATRVVGQNEKKPISTFTSSASNLLIEIKDRLSTQSSKISSNSEDSIETQKATMAVDDDSKISS